MISYLNHSIHGFLSIHKQIIYHELKLIRSKIKNLLKNLNLLNQMNHFDIILYEKETQKKFNYLLLSINKNYLSYSILNFIYFNRLLDIESTNKFKNPTQL